MKGGVAAVPGAVEDGVTLALFALRLLVLGKKVAS